jgi:hypothetical protein
LGPLTVLTGCVDDRRGRLTAVSGEGACPKCGDRLTVLMGGLSS